MLSFSYVFEDCTSQGTKIKAEEYSSSGKYIIIDQGQKNIAGYTDCTEGVFEDVPAIIFGDHTRCIKYIDKPFFLGADGVKLLKAKVPNANYRYLFYALSSVQIPNTGYNRHFKWLKEAQIKYPEVQEQETIATILDHATYIIERRKQQLDLINELVKARFIEMFGDPDKALESDTCVRNVADIRVGLVIKPARFYSSESKDHKAFRSVNVGEGFIKDADWVYFTEQGSKENENTKAHTGDVLVVRSGYPGTSCVVPAEYDGANVIDLIIAHPDSSKVLPEYLCAFTNYDHGKNQIVNMQHGVAQKHFNVSMYQDMKIVVPPLSEQEVFVAFMQQTDKSKL